MTWRLNNLRTIGMALAAVLMGALLPAGARAEELIFANNTGSPIIVQAACVVRGVMRRDRPYLLKQGDVTPAIVLPGNKVITIYNGINTNQVIFQGTIPGGMVNQAFVVNVDPATGNVVPMPK